MIQEDIITAIATPGGTGAISVVRLSGKGSIDLISSVFSKSLSERESHTLHFGLITTPSGESIDEVLVSLFHEGKSFTGEESVEISCHASPFIQAEILKTLVQKGARIAEPGEFTMRAFMNGKMDLSQAEAVADLISSQSKLAHGVAFNQLRGGFSSELKQLRERLIDFASLIELELDFAEEDVEFADRSQLLSLVSEVLKYIYKLIDSFELGNAIKNGLPVAFVGRPNAGKSTVLNALLNEERAIVSEIAGTTRDTVEENLNIEGINFRLIDTAGIREASDEIERKGIERSLDKIQKASLVVYLYDSSLLTADEILEDRELYLQNKKCLIIGTKNDLDNPLKEEVKIHVEMIAESPVHLLSMKDPADIETLRSLLFEQTIGSRLDDHSTIVSNARHVENLEKAATALESAKNGLETGITGDFVAMDIRQAMYKIGSITGSISEDDLLANIFGKFCIGK